MAREEKRKLLLESAYSLFLEYGYRKTSISDITKKAGVAKGTFYLYFKSKGEIFGHLWVESVNEAAVRLSEYLGQFGSSKEKFRQFLKAVFTISNREWSFLGKCLSRRTDFFTAVEELEIGFQDQGRMIMKGVIRDILNEGIERGEFRDIDVEQVGGVVKGVMTLVLFIDKIEISTHLSPDEFVDSLCDIFLAGIRAE